MADVEYIRYNRIYAVSRDGRVLRNGEPCSPRPHTHGYLYCGRNLLVHRMVATVWIRPPQRGEQIHHINHDKTDNRVENLEWVSRKTHLTERHADDLDRFKHSKMSAEGKAKLRALRLGTKLSDKTKRKIGRAIKRLGIKPPVGARTKFSEAEIAALRARRSVACVVHGVRYSSFTEAGKALGERPLSLRKRCLSENFPEYRLADA